MKLNIAPGKYILAVSGGVDSIALLDILSRQPELKLVVAHFNHGIRTQAKADEALVVKTAEHYNLPVKVGYGRLGPFASEDAARKARYDFLNTIRKKHSAKAVITAHHQDDAIESAILNLLRGTGPQGLVSIRTNKDVVRPLLQMPKGQIIRYAKNHKLKWIEDETNSDTKYLRNYIRLNILPGLDKGQEVELVKKLDKVANIQQKKHRLLATLSRRLLVENQIDRQKFISLPAPVADELVHYWLRITTPQANRKTVKRLSSFIKTARAGQRYSVNKGLNLEISQKTALLRTTG
jgi:tRNA(Ile)-lysidine synthase